MSFISPAQLMAKSLLSMPWGDKIANILAAALNAVDPAAAIAQHLHRSDDRLTVQGRHYDLADYRRVFVVGAGKAGAPMAYAVSKILGDRLTQGVIVVKDGYAQSREDLHPAPGLDIIEAGHPIPDERGVRAARRIIALLETTRADDLVICLISGGASALLVSPAEGITLNDLQQLTSALLASGANINEINTMRKHLDRVKGGKLARLAAPAHLVSLILSDVIGDPLDVIGSGPTAPDSSTFEDAYQVLERYGLLDRVPPAVLAVLQRGRQGDILENPAPHDPLFAKVHNAIIGSNILAANAALAQADKEGLNPMLLTTYLQGEARQVGLVLAGILRQISDSDLPVPRPACLVAGGETTVTLNGDGLGGRNQELALGAVQELAGLPAIALVALATDGGDGPTDAAGAVVTGETQARARQLGLDPNAYLARNDSYHFFDPLGDLLKPGPTQTNVNDLTFLFAF